MLAGCQPGLTREFDGLWPVRPGGGVDSPVTDVWRVHLFASRSMKTRLKGGGPVDEAANPQQPVRGQSVPRLAGAEGWPDDVSTNRPALCPQLETSQQTSPLSAGPIDGI